MRRRRLGHREPVTWGRNALRARPALWQTHRTMTFCSIIIGRRVGTAAATSTSPAPSTRRPFASARGLFRVSGPDPAKSPMTDVPRLRHDPARRRPAGGPDAVGRGQARHRPAPRRPRRRLHRGRLARRHPQGHRVLRRAAAAELRLRERHARRVRRRPAGPASGPPTTRRSARCSTRSRPSSPWSPRATSGTSRRRCARRRRRTSR